MPDRAAIRQRLTAEKILRPGWPADDPGTGEAAGLRKIALLQAEVRSLEEIARSRQGRIEALEAELRDSRRRLAAGSEQRPERQQG